MGATPARRRSDSCARGVEGVSCIDKLSCPAGNRSLPRGEGHGPPKRTFFGTFWNFPEVRMFRFRNVKFAHKKNAILTLFFGLECFVFCRFKHSDQVGTGPHLFKQPETSASMRLKRERARLARPKRPPLACGLPAAQAGPSWTASSTTYAAKHKNTGARAPVSPHTKE